MSGRYYRQTHTKTCKAIEDAEQPPMEQGVYGSYGDTCPDDVSKILQDEELLQWLDSISDHDMSFYKHCQRTVSVPYECREEWQKAFMLPLAIWEQGEHAQSIRMHLVLLRALAAPVHTSQDGRQHQVVKAMKDRIARLFRGDLQQLWEEAHADLPHHHNSIRTEDQVEYAKNAKATHYAMAGQYHDAKQTLTSNGLLPFSASVLDQFDDIFAVRESPPVEPLPDYHDPDDDTYRIDIDQIWIKDIDGNPHKVPTLPWVMDHLPKYKASDQIGARYEHYQHMPQQLVHHYVQAALHGRFTGAFANMWRSGLVYAGDKGKLDKQGRQAARPIVVGMALRRITGRVPCAQLKDQISSLFLKYRQLGVAVPAGIEVAWHTVNAMLTYLDSEAQDSRDPDDMPVVLAWDQADAFPNCWRSSLFKNVVKHMPTLLSYTAQCYEGSGQIMAVSDSKLVKTWDCSTGVWQGDPLGTHHMMFAIIDFLQAMLDKFTPENVFNSEQSSRRITAQQISVADDLTHVTRRRHVIDLARFVVQEAPKHGVVLNISKWQIFMPLHSEERSVESLALYHTLREMGADISIHGIDRLLGAPVATVQAAVADGGHIDRVTTKAVSLVQKIANLHTPQSQYGMLLYCASTTMTHLARLMPPHILNGFSERLKQALLIGVESMLTLQNFHHYQRALTTLPTREGGLGLTSAHDVLITAYIASHGATIVTLKKTLWSESPRIAQVLVAKASLLNCIEQYNQLVRESDVRLRAKLLDPERPDMWPPQSILSAVQFHATANELEAEMAVDQPRMAGCFASMRRKGSGSFLRVIHSKYEYRVSPELFRLQISMRIMAPIPVLRSEKCICGYAGPDLENGMHFITGCNRVSKSTTRHNMVLNTVQKFLERLGYIVRPGENAAWFRYDKHLRPFDIVAKADPTQKWIGIDIGLADPTRTGMLQSGEHYFKSGKAADRLCTKKHDWMRNAKRMHGGLKEPVDHKPVIFETTGSWGKSASDFLKPLIKECKELQMKLPSGKWTWAAQTYPAYLTQQISFHVSKFSAMAVLEGSRAILKARAARCSHL
jgi:hypothetical protein